MELTTASFMAAVQTTLYETKKCPDTATNASSGHRENQSIVQPLIKPGNFNERLRNFSPTCKFNNYTLFQRRILNPVF